MGSFFKATCPTGELGNGRIKRRGTGTAFSSMSAAQRAIERYKGPEAFTVEPAGPIGCDSAPKEPITYGKKSHGGAREKSGAQMPSGQKAVNVTTTFDPTDRMTLTAFGGGKLAIGLRKAAELVRLYLAGKLVEK